jgi:hypothetical protein
MAGLGGDGGVAGERAIAGNPIIKTMLIHTV